MHHGHLDAFRESHATTVSMEQSERRTWLVVGISAIMMAVELVIGWATSSLALFADGVHMATHVGALGLSGVAYWLARRWATHEAFTFGTGKVFALSGFTSAIILLATAAWMVVEAGSRLLSPRDVAFGEALPVAIVGFVVNLVCAFVLGHNHDHGGAHDHGGHHDEEHEHRHGHSHGETHSHAPTHSHDHDHAPAHHAHEHDGHAHKPAEDHNLNAARLHVLADALTSVLAIAAIALGYTFGWRFLDPLVGLVGAAVVGRWALGLTKSTAKQLLDVVPSLKETAILRTRLEAIDDVAVADLHLWEMGPGQLGCIAKIVSSKPREASFYRKVIRDAVRVSHLTVEVQRCEHNHDDDTEGSGSDDRDSGQRERREATLTT